MPGILSNPRKRKRQHDTMSHIKVEPERTGQPTAPCFWCGERGWCRHNDRY